MESSSQYGKKPTHQYNSIGPQNSSTVILGNGSQQVTFQISAGNNDLSTYMLTGTLSTSATVNPTNGYWFRLITQYSPITNLRYVVGGSLMESIDDIQFYNRTIATDIYDNIDLSGCSFFYEKPGDKNGYNMYAIPVSEYLIAGSQHYDWTVGTDDGITYAAPNANLSTGAVQMKQMDTIQFPSKYIGNSSIKNLSTGARNAIAPNITNGNLQGNIDYSLTDGDSGQMTDRVLAQPPTNIVQIKFSIPLSLLVPHSVFSINQFLPMPQQELTLTFGPKQNMICYDIQALQNNYNYSISLLSLNFTSTFDNIPQQHNIIVPRLQTILTNSKSYTLELRRQYLFTNKIYFAFFNDGDLDKSNTGKFQEQKYFSGLADANGNANVRNIVLKLNTNILQNSSTTDKEVYQFMRDNIKFKDFEYFLRKSNSFWVDFQGDNQVGINTSELTANPQITYEMYRTEITHPNANNGINVYTSTNQPSTQLFISVVYSGILSIDASKQLWQID